MKLWTWVIDRVLTWWNGATLNTMVWTRRHGEKVGEDSQGNVFYQTAGGVRRWVIFNGVSDASRVDTEWHGWLHHTFDSPPTVDPLLRRAWERPHQPNQTGTVNAYHPPGSLFSEKLKDRQDYDAWQPE